MFFFRNRPCLVETGALSGFTDYHSHLLPGVDDGVQTPEESIEALAAMEEWGVKAVWLTPHIMEDMPNNTEHLHKRFQELDLVYKGSIKLRLSAENMLDNLFEERLEKNDLLPLGESGKCLLIETSYFNPPMDLYGTLERIRLKGYCPVLAHPERYTYMTDRDYLKLKEVNVKFQLNLPSLVGMYGKAAQKKSEKLIEKGMYDVSGSDIHALHPFGEAMLAHSGNSRYFLGASKLRQVL